MKFKRGEISVYQLTWLDKAMKLVCIRYRLVNFWKLHPDLLCLTFQIDTGGVLSPLGRLLKHYAKIYSEKKGTETNQ